MINKGSERMIQLCLQCKSKNIWKRGFRYNKRGKKQKYHCKDCNFWLIEDDGFKRMRKIAAIASILSGHLAAVSGGVGFCGGRISIPRLTQVWEEKLIFSFIFVCPVVIRQLTDLLSGFSVRRF